MLSVSNCRERRYHCLEAVHERDVEGNDEQTVSIENDDAKVGLQNFSDALLIEDDFTGELESEVWLDSVEVGDASRAGIVVQAVSDWVTDREVDSQK